MYRGFVLPALLVLLTIAVRPGGLPPGWHGAHPHAVGDCSDVGLFKKSTGHVNSAGRRHGLLSPAGSDNADLPKLQVAADGSAGAEMFATRIGLRGEPALLDGDGSALVIHAGPDDHVTPPIGN